MSYDFAVLLPEGAGEDDDTAIATAIAVFKDDTVAGPEADPRLTAFIADLAAVGARDENDGWASVWPLDSGPHGLALPIT